MFDAQQLAESVKCGSMTEQEARKELVQMYAFTQVFPRIMEAFRSALAL
jgi:hypothetical protein